MTRVADEVFGNGLISNHVASFLDQNEAPCSMRLVCKAVARALVFRSIRLSKVTPGPYFKQHWKAPGVARGLNLEHRRKLTCLTAASGAVDNLEVAVSVTGDALNGAMMEDAASAGKLASCRWLWQRRCPWGCALAKAARAGHQEVCVALLDNGCPWSAEAVLAAICGGHMILAEDLKKWRPWNVKDLRPKDLYVAAAEGYHLEQFRKLVGDSLLRWTRGLWVSGATRMAMLAAAVRSHTPDWAPKVDWLEELFKDPGCTRGNAVIAAAAACPDGMERLRWLEARGCPMVIIRRRLLLSSKAEKKYAGLVHQVFKTACRSGKLDVARYLWEKCSAVPEWNTVGRAAALFAAAETGQLDFLRATHPQWSADDVALQRVMWGAARGGHLGVLSWAAEREVLSGGYRIREDKLLVVRAAESGNVTITSWVAERNPHSLPECLKYAARNSSDVALEWMTEHSHEGRDARQALQKAQQRYHDLYTRHWMLENLPSEEPASSEAWPPPNHHHTEDAGLQQDSGMDGHQGALNWAVDNTSPISSSAGSVSSRVLKFSEKLFGRASSNLGQRSISRTGSGLNQPRSSGHGNNNDRQEAQLELQQQQGTASTAGGLSLTPELN